MITINQLMNQEDLGRKISDEIHLTDLRQHGHQSNFCTEMYSRIYMSPSFFEFN